LCEAGTIFGCGDNWSWARKRAINIARKSDTFKVRNNVRKPSGVIILSEFDMIKVCECDKGWGCGRGSGWSCHRESAEEGKEKKIKFDVSHYCSDTK
jgi:hypothetical protein